MNLVFILVGVFFQLVEMNRPRKKSTDNHPINSSTSSDDDKTTPPVEICPFSFDSLQKLTENPSNPTSIELDHLYPSNTNIITMHKTDEDDDLLLAAAIACQSK